jgi:mono/diheme cytochrome c family protein
MFRRILIVLLAAAVAGIGGFAALAWRPPIAAIAKPSPSSFPPELVARGATLAGAGYCATCHTTKGGKLYAGDYAMVTGFGTIYSTNITPDPKTGIGTWSEAAFRRAMHQGVARDGSYLFPAFPYDHFTKLSDGDVAALYAYLMTRQPVRAVAHADSLPFPLNIRMLQAGWRLLFFRPGRFEPKPERGPQWNRGAYLAQGISHCGACHTPRNLLGAEERNRTYAGAPVDSWFAPPLTAANPSPVPWDQAELYAYLRTGFSQFHGTSAGPMAPVVHDGLAKLPDTDVHALAVYFGDVDDAAARANEAKPAIAKALAADKIEIGLLYDPKTRLYTAACASCHYNSGDSPNPLRPDLALNSAVNLADPTNLIRVILYGIDAKQGIPGVVMPGFAYGFGNDDVARIAAYLRATRTAQAPWPDLEKKIASIRAQGNIQQ